MDQTNVAQSSAPPQGGPTSPTPSSRSINWGLAGLAVVGCAYVGLVDPNTSSFYPGCPFRAMTGFDCPGCGATRALHSAITGHPLQALDHNAFFVMAAVLGVVGFAVAKVRRRMGKPAIAWRLSVSGAIALGLLTCMFWITRNMPWEPLSWLGSGASGG
ncbi:Protein of unknown function DUF2752 [Acidimicrobiia bacterium]